jgi:tryptophan synthase beta chain
VSAGLDYAAIGPEHAFYREQQRIQFAYACDDEVIEVFQNCSRLEGIIPALESTHALVHGLKRAKAMGKDEILIINLSGRGDKDVNQVAKLLGVKL